MVSWPQGVFDLMKQKLKYTMTSTKIALIMSINVTLL